MALGDFPVFGEHPSNCRYEIIRDFKDNLEIWDNDQGLCVPGSCFPYSQKVKVFHLERELERRNV